MATIPSTAAELVTEIQETQRILTIKIPDDLRNTTNARRIACLKRQRVEEEARLSTLVTELSAAVQA